jgi:hypothetical protein
MAEFNLDINAMSSVRRHHVPEKGYNVHNFHGLSIVPARLHSIYPVFTRVSTLEISHCAADMLSFLRISDTLVGMDQMLTYDMLLIPATSRPPQIGCLATTLLYADDDSGRSQEKRIPHPKILMADVADIGYCAWEYHVSWVICANHLL